jgi:hypothetical protein
MVGNIHRDQPAWRGITRILPPGRSIHIESHTSPRTLANDVKTSANTTSEKYIGWSEGEKIHRRTALKPTTKVRNGGKANQRYRCASRKKHIAFTFLESVDFADEDDENRQSTDRGDKCIRVHEEQIPVNDVYKQRPCPKTPGRVCE